MLDAAFAVLLALVILVLLTRGQVLYRTGILDGPRLDAVRRGGYSALLLREGSAGALRITVGHSGMEVSTADGTELAATRFPDSPRTR
ncbi:hypothetical protein [Pseudonocardia sp. NPDC046786]|uniref:hypothetical protein n=1 Tax=Pseudonocardia sp. NPDC046786 TaxID=3155471 RepID=UPI0033FA5D23